MTDDGTDSSDGSVGSEGSLESFSALIEDAMEDDRMLEGDGMGDPIDEVDV